MTKKLPSNLHESVDIDRLKPRVVKFFGYYHKGKNGKQVQKDKPSAKNITNLARMIHLERVKAYEQGKHDAEIKPSWWQRILSK
jgi:hypothetical protein